MLIVDVILNTEKTFRFVLTGNLALKKPTVLLAFLFKLFVRFFRFFLSSDEICTSNGFIPAARQRPKRQARHKRRFSATHFFSLLTLFRNFSLFRYLNVCGFYVVRFLRNRVAVKYVVFLKNKKHFYLLKVHTAYHFCIRNFFPAKLFAWKKIYSRCTKEHRSDNL